MISLPVLNKGEHYAGLIIDKAGFVTHHLILLPGDNDDADWDAQIEWAKQQGGELPNRQEQALLYTNLKHQFKNNWYWSGEQHASNASYAWGQVFGHGIQDGSIKSYEGRARAVRRLPI